jgi:hypothetical protein
LIATDLRFDLALQYYIVSPGATIFLGVNDIAPGTNHDAPLGSAPPYTAVPWLIVILLLGAWLRCSQAHESLWLDELHTSWVVADGAGQIADRARAGNQSPLYFDLVWCVVRLLGHHEWTLRLISLVAGSGLILATYGLVRRWSRSVTSGLLAALLVAVSRDCIFYAQEARPYALLQLSAVAHAALFVDLLYRPTRARRAAFVCGAAWLFYLHYTSFLFLLAEAVFLAAWLMWGKPRSAYHLRAAAIDALAIGVLIVPASRHVLQIAEHRQNWSRIVDVWPSIGLQTNFFVFILLPVLGVLVGIGLGLRRTSFRWRCLAASWTILWLSLPPLMAWLSTWSGLASLAMLRYLVVSLVGAIVFAALCHATFASRMYRAILGVAIVVSAVGTSGMVRQWNDDGRWIGDRNEPWNALVSWLNERWPADPFPVLLCPGLLEDAALAQDADPDLREYCLFPLRGMYRLRAAPLVPVPTERQVRLAQNTRQCVREHRGAWVVMRAGEKTAAALADALSRQLATRQVEMRRFGDLVVVRLVRP